jgi:hypothetical protein
MPRPKKKTLADRAVAMMARGKTDAEIAKKLKCSDTYVRVCRRRQRLVEAGYQRVRSRVYQNGWRTRREIRKAETPEQRTARLKKIAAKALATRLRRKATLEKQRAQALRASRVAARLHKERSLRRKQEELMLASSIVARRAYVDRILAAWRQADGQEARA